MEKNCLWVQMTFDPSHVAPVASLRPLLLSSRPDAVLTHLDSKTPVFTGVLTLLVISSLSTLKMAAIRTQQNKNPKASGVS